MARFVTVDDPDDPRLAVFRRNERGLASRPERRDDGGSGLFMAEGDLVVERALAAGCVPVIALADGTRIPAVAERLGIDVFVGGDAVRRAVTRLGAPQAIVALFQRPPRPSAEELLATAERIVIVEGVDNPANVGAIVRNAAGLGWDAIVLDETSADPLARRALRVAMGTAFSIPHARTDRLVAAFTAAITDGLTVYALTPSDAADDLDSVAPVGRRAVLIGSERDGLSDAALAAVTHRVRIPMAAGVDSLNAAASAAIVCHALRR